MSLFYLADQDDFWLPNKVKTMREALIQTGAELIVHDSYLAWGKITNRGKRLSEEFRQRGIIPENNHFGCMMVFRRSLLEIIIPIHDPIISHDFLLDYFSRARGTFQYLETPLMVYRRHDKNVSQSAPVGEYIKPSSWARMRNMFDYFWLRRRMNQLIAVSQRLQGEKNLDVLPDIARKRFEKDYRVASLRAKTVFEAPFLQALMYLPAYRRQEISFTVWGKDVVANGFRLHKMSST